MTEQNGSVTLTKAEYEALIQKRKSAVTIQVSSYEGHPTLILSTGTRKPITFGVTTWAVICENAERIKAAVEAVKSGKVQVPTSQPVTRQASRADNRVQVPF